MKTAKEVLRSVTIIAAVAKTHDQVLDPPKELAAKNPWCSRFLTRTGEATAFIEAASGERLRIQDVSDKYRNLGREETVRIEISSTRGRICLHFRKEEGCEEFSTPSYSLY